MKTKKQIRSIIDKTIGVTFKDGKLLDKKALSFVKLFKSQPRIEAIQLLSEYSKRMKFIINSTIMVVESAIPLSQQDKLNLAKKFSSRFTIHSTEYKLNPSLLGGLKVKIGDHIYEDSIMSRIRQIGEAIHG